MNFLSFITIRGSTVSPHVSDHVMDSAENFERRFDALREVDLQLLRRSRALHEFMPRAIAFLRCEPTEDNVVQVTRYLTGTSPHLPLRLEMPASDLGAPVKTCLSNLLRSPGGGFFSMKESAQKTFNKLDALEQRVSELTWRLDRPFPLGFLEVRDRWPVDRDGVFHVTDPTRTLFNAVYTEGSFQVLNGHASEWVFFERRGLSYFKEWLTELCSDGLLEREYDCLVRILDTMREDSHFRSACFEQTLWRPGPRESPLRILFDLQILWCFHQACRDEARQLEIYHVERTYFWRQVLLKTVEDYHVEPMGDDKHSEFDDIFLYLACHFHDELQMCGVPIHPLRRQRAQRWEPDIARAQHSIDRVTLGLDTHFHQRLLNWDGWRAAIKERYGDEFRRLDEDLGAHLSAHEHQARRGEISESVYLDQCQLLKKLHARATAELWLDLTAVEVARLEQEGHAMNPLLS